MSDVYSYERTAGSKPSLADLLTGYFEDVAKALQHTLAASSPKFRVSEKKLGDTYTVEFTVDGDPSMFDRKVTFKVEGATLRFEVERWTGRKMENIGTGVASINSTPDGLAKVVDVAMANRSYEY